jgi:hypothetical protein
MAIDSLRLSTSLDTVVRIPVLVDAGVDAWPQLAEPIVPDAMARWAAWQAKGIAHDHAVGSRLLTVAACVAIALAVYSVFG